MFARIRKSMEENDEGFTLIELLVVIIIIGILAAIAIPVFLSQRKKGYDASVKSDLRNAATAEESYLTDNPTGYSTDQSALSTADGFKNSPNNTFDIAVSGANSYCIVGKNSSSSNYYTYDSGAGGLNGTAAASLTAAKALCTSGPTTWVGSLT